MNHIYRSIWNEALGAWVAVSELSRGRCKSSSNRRKLLVTGLLVCSSSAWALPTGEQLMAGQASVSTPNANTMQINQSSQKAVINWQGFSVGQQEAVNIQQPNAQAALLNRVVGQDASQIQGRLNANGQVYLVNPNGVIFGRTAQVDVGGLVATTHNITNADFMNGNHHFTQNGATGTVENHGTINTPAGGVVALIGEKVTNTGTINTPQGTTALAAGKTVDLDFKGDGLVEVKVTEAALNAQINNRGAIQADGGRVVLSAKAAGQLIDTVINQDGIVRAQGLAQRNGEIILEAAHVNQTGTLDASGQTGGTVNVNVKSIVDAGTTNADGSGGSGGNINMFASDAIIQTAAANTHANGTTTGGKVHLESTNSTYSSGTLSATGQQGGTVDVLSSDRVVLAAANVDASGSQKGGLIRVGGDFHGTNANLPNAKTTTINGATRLKADGGQGQVVVWSNDTTDHYGSISANLGGNIEVSSHGTLTYAGAADAGMGGSLLLDPKNIIISATAGPAAYALIDPHISAGNNFGAFVTLLGTTTNGVFTENGNVAVSSAGDDLTATNAGAAYLFNTTTGALLSTLTGSTANDQVSNGGFTALTNGNYVVASNNWNNGTITNAGAVTWGNGLTGVSGIVSATNSLVGSTAGDQVGQTDFVTFISGITALSNGNYVVASSNWNNSGTAVAAGAVTWGNGSTGTSGVISSANSLVGTTANDRVGAGVNSITALTNGNYVVASSNWNGTSAASVGAVTWGNGNIGTTGAVTSTNSLVGSTTNDIVGAYGITALTNGNYVVSSVNWNNGGTAAAAGAATWGNGNGGTVGVVSSTNSLVGTTAGDQVSNFGITALTNGNYVVDSADWDNGGVTNVGAVTWGNGVLGTTGAVTGTNSLIGSTAGDIVGNRRVTALSNGNYVVASSNWNNSDTAAAAGAVTWGNGTGGTIGTVTNTNSLVGTTANDQVGSEGITALTNGNYVVASRFWNNGAATSAGAITWGNGTGGTIGAVTSTNSLVGSTTNDQVGSIGRNGVTALTNGNYVVASSFWDNGAIVDAGAATWGNGTGGTVGALTSTNSLVGTKTNDQVGIGGITALTNGNYVVSSNNWNNSGPSPFPDGMGAATWGNGFTGIAGVVSSTNSLVGASPFDAVGSFITALKNGNYVVKTGGGFSNLGTGIGLSGAVTWANGTTGRTGIVNTLNSLTGSVAGDVVGKVTGLDNGNYIVSSGVWDNNGLVDAGQVRIATPQNIFFNNGVGQTMTFNPLFITETLATGTNITLQASNDITLNTGADIIVGGNNGGAFTLQAGRNINLGSRIVTANGNFTAIAGDPNALPADRDPGTPTITLGSGATINAGTGKVILAAIGGNFVNNSGSTAPITANQWLVYSTDPRLNTRNGMVADAKHYGQD
jgi:filamentous hemagglutinin family protein